MSRKEMTEVLDLVPDLRQHHGTILGLLDNKVVCMPEETRFNANMAVYGASGSMKTRAFLYEPHSPECCPWRIPNYL